MLPALPLEMASGAAQTAMYFFTFVAVVWSFLFTTRLA
jgi:hypothetical protein